MKKKKIEQQDATFQTSVDPIHGDAELPGFGSVPGTESAAIAKQAECLCFHPDAVPGRAAGWPHQIIHPFLPEPACAWQLAGQLSPGPQADIH